MRTKKEVFFCGSCPSCGKYISPGYMINRMTDSKIIKYWPRCPFCNSNVYQNQKRRKLDMDDWDNADVSMQKLEESAVQNLELASKMKDEIVDLCEMITAFKAQYAQSPQVVVLSDDHFSDDEPYPDSLEGIPVMITPKANVLEIF